MIRLLGRIKRNNSVVILNIYGKPLANRVREIGCEVLLKNFKDGFVFKPKGKFHATIADDKRIQIALTKFIKRGDLEISDKLEVPIYIELSDWKISDVGSKCSNGLPVLDIVPKNLLSKRAALRFNKSQYCVDISLKKLSEVCKKEKIRCLFKKSGDYLIIARSNSPVSRRLTSHSNGRVQISIPKGLLSNGELDYLNNKKSWLPIKIKFNLKSFGLRIEDLYSVPEEKELVSFLSKSGLEVSAKDYLAPYDIHVLEKNFGIEIHNSLPGNFDLSLRHGVRSGMARLRILEANYIMERSNLDNFFVILNNSWTGNKHLMELVDFAKPSVHILFTDFKKSWFGKIGNEILERVC